MTPDSMNPARTPISPSFGLDDVIARNELARRPMRAPDVQGENAAYLALASRFAAGPVALLQSLTEIALSLCSADTAGVSLLETDATGLSLFRWAALSGRLAAQVNGTTPRDFSPCGVCLDRNAPIHLIRPERYFTYFQSAGVPFCEALVLPFTGGGKPHGTIWIITHDDRRQFDMEDVRIMTRLATLAGAAYAAINPPSPS